jgi:hypothetical protein
MSPGLGTLLSTPEGLLYVAPLGLTVAVFLLFAGEHFWEVKHARFQALFIRSVLLFPVTATLAFFGGLNYAALPWVDVVIALLEGYIMILFFGLYVGWAWCKGDVYANLLCSARTNVCCHTPCSRCGPPYGSGKAALASIRLQMYQFVIVKPLVNLAKAVSVEQTGQLDIQVFTTPFQLVSMIFALFGVLNLSHALQKGGSQSKTSAKVGPQDEAGTNNLLDGLQAFQKFVVMRTFLLFVALYSTVIKKVIEDGTLKAPATLCEALNQTDPVLFAEECHGRFEAWVVMVVMLILVLFAALYFRPHSVDSLSAEHRRGEESRGYLAMRVLALGDVCSSFLVPPAVHDASV